MGQLTIDLRPEQHAKIRKVNEISGENVKLCMQCGTCSAVCPMVDSMEMTTRQAMHLLQFGLTDDVIDSKLATLCASCHTCSVRCPRGIDVAKVMEAARLMVSRKNVDTVHPREVDKDMLEEAPQIVFVSGFRKFTA
jgi:heterodisulfide reductase subunit C